MLRKDIHDTNDKNDTNGKTSRSINKKLRKSMVEYPCSAKMQSCSPLKEVEYNFPPFKCGLCLMTYF